MPGMASNPRRSTSSPFATSPSHTPRYTSAHSNSSAFSKNAQPNEDWTQVSDLAERRRIQNRIAQRNYRQKLKRRLEELEHRSGSPSASPERSPGLEGEQSVTGSSTSGSAGRRRRTSEQPSPPSSRGPSFEIFGSQAYDQFCARPSPPPPPSPRLPDATTYVDPEHSRFSPHSSQPLQFPAWSAASQPHYYATSSHAPQTLGTSSYARPEPQYWGHRGHEDSWGWSYTSPNGHQSTPQQPPQQGHLQTWSQQGSTAWQEGYHDVNQPHNSHTPAMKITDDGIFHWASLDGYPTPPRSADMINPMVNPFEEFLDIKSE